MSSPTPNQRSVLPESQPKPHLTSLFDLLMGRHAHKLEDEFDGSEAESVDSFSREFYNLQRNN